MLYLLMTTKIQPSELLTPNTPIREKGSLFLWSLEESIVSDIIIYWILQFTTFTLGPLQQLQRWGSLVMDVTGHTCTMSCVMPT